QERPNMLRKLPNTGSALKKTETTEDIQVAGKEFQVIFDKSTGSLSSFIYGGQEVIKEAVRPNFTRPATDNDRRGWKPEKKLKYWYSEPKLVSLTAQPKG